MADELNSDAESADPSVMSLEGEATAWTMADIAPGESASAEAHAARQRKPIASRLGRLVEAHTEERTWRKQAEGEKAVAKSLAELPSEWTVLHDLPTGDGGGRISHLLIGPAGVLSLSTRWVRGSVTVSGRQCVVNGFKTEWLGKAIDEARRVQGLLDDDILGTVPVEPVLVLVCERLQLQGPPDGAHVVTRRHLPRLVLTMPPVLPVEQVEAIRAVALDPATWADRLPGARRRAARAEAAAARTQALERAVEAGETARAPYRPEPGAYNPAAGLGDPI